MQPCFLVGGLEPASEGMPHSWCAYEGIILAMMPASIGLFYSVRMRFTDAAHPQLQWKSAAMLVAQYLWKTSVGSLIQRALYFPQYISISPIDWSGMCMDKHSGVWPLIQPSLVALNQTTHAESLLEMQSSFSCGKWQQNLPFHCTEANLCFWMGSTDRW